MVKLNTFQPMRKAPTVEELDQQVRKAAQQMEGKFLEEMIKQMRSTVQEGGGFIPNSNAEKIFREQLDQEYVGQWTNKGGLGLADMIYQQIMDKFGHQMGMHGNENSKPRGPIQIKTEGARPALPATTSPNGKSSYIFDLRKLNLENLNIEAPWSGQVTQAKPISSDQFLLQLKHLNGLSSQMVFRGLPDPSLRLANVEKPVDVEAGQKLGALSPEAKSFTWIVDVSGSV